MAACQSLAEEPTQMMPRIPASLARTATATLATILGAVALFGQVPPDPDLCTMNRAGELVHLGGIDPPADRAPPAGGRREATLLSSYPSFDFWSLRTRGERDTAGNLHFAVWLYEFSNPNENFDRFVINPAGELVETWRDWTGVGGKPVVTCADGRNVYLRPVGTGENGCVDSANYIHLFAMRAVTGSITEVHYAQLDPQGNTVIDWKVITNGAAGWSGYVQSVVTANDTLVATWYRDTEDICAVMSTDGGVTWSDILVLVDRPAAEQTSMLKTLVGRDDFVHLVYRSWDFNTGTSRLYYTKLCPDWLTVCVGETIFRVGAAWYPFVSLDDAGDLHITFGTSYQLGTDLLYTCLRGDLDLGGAPASDELLTMIPERTFVSDPDKARYPVNLPDENGTVHVVFEEGTYGCKTDKDLFYTRFACPGDLNADGSVDLSDLGILLAAYGTCVGDPDYNRSADSDDSGCVDLSDLGTLLAAYGTNCL